MNYDYISYDKLYTIKDENSNISHSIELDNNNILSLNTWNDLNLISFNFGENKEMKYKINIVNSLLTNTEKTVLSINKITDNIISLNLTNKKNTFDFRATEFMKVDDEDNDELLKNISIRDSFFINTDDLQKNQEEKTEDKSEEFTKILTINLNNEDIFGKKENRREYIFNKNYQLIGCLSEKNPLLLLKYIEEKKDNQKNLFYIFDYNTNQFINSFQCNNGLDSPRLLILLNFGKIVNDQGFIIMDNELNIYQYFFDEENEKTVYFINRIKTDENKNNQMSCFVSLIKRNNYI